MAGSASDIEDASTRVHIGQEGQQHVVVPLLGQRGVLDGQLQILLPETVVKVLEPEELPSQDESQLTAVHRLLRHGSTPIRGGGVGIQCLRLGARG